MGSVDAEIIGGPRDGEILVVELRADGFPPPILLAYLGPDRLEVWRQATGHAPSGPIVKTVRMVRVADVDDEGRALWRYLWNGGVA
jgi:hypothetical protein